MINISITNMIKGWGGSGNVPSGDYIITEDNKFMTTESGDKLIKETV